MQNFDILIRNGTVYDGSGKEPIQADVATQGDQIVAVYPLPSAQGKIEINAQGQAVAPGFINMLSWSSKSLIEDGHSQSEIRQGVTLQVMGEGWSMGPLNEAMKQELIEKQTDIKYEIEWTTLGEYLDHLVQRGISTNVASFVGATTVRIHALGHENREPTSEELEHMRKLVRAAMEEGALGVASALIYAPGHYAKTPELIELSKATALYGGMYISHLRSEGEQFLEAIDELIQIAREGNIPAEIYHLKAAGKSNWNKLDEAIHKIEVARTEGLQITADMYLYTAGATGLAAAIPPWVHEGGFNELKARLKDPAIRKQIRREMATPSSEWENLLFDVESSDGVLLMSFKNEKLKSLTGKTLAQVANMRGLSAEETVMDLVLEDDSHIGAAYFMISEENVAQQVQLPWMSFGSDAKSQKPEGVFLKSNTHPRAYGNFARLLGRYVREQKLISLQEAVRRLTSFPAENLKLEKRGRLTPGYYADVAVFDPETIIDHATFEQPHQYSTGVSHVLVNGVLVLKDGEHTGATPGRFLRGPGSKPK
jgi:N-acyl-D-amino-acid deacylase